jgi:hypothetical protein
MKNRINSSYKVVMVAGILSKIFQSSVFLITCTVFWYAVCRWFLI